MAPFAEFEAAEVAVRKIVAGPAAPTGTQAADGAVGALSGTSLRLALWAYLTCTAPAGASCLLQVPSTRGLETACGAFTHAGQRGYANKDSFVLHYLAATLGSARLIKMHPRGGVHLMRL